MRVIQAFGAAVLVAVVGTLFVLAFATRTFIFILTDTEETVNKDDWREVRNALIIGALIIGGLFMAQKTCAETIPYGTVVGVVNTQENNAGGGVVVGGNQVITVAHVVKGADYVMVFFYDEPQGRRAHIAKVSYHDDLALLTLRVPDEIPTARFGNTPNVAETSYFLGHPLGHKWLFLRGYVAHTDVYLGDIKDTRKTFAVDIHVQSGSSGGGVFDEKWRLTGIVSSRHKQLDLAYVIPVETIRKFLKD